MNIDELLSESKTIPFVLDGGKGKKGKVKMQSPSNTVGINVREQFFQHGKHIAAAQAAIDAGREYDGQPLPIGMELCCAKAVMACIAQDDPLANMTEEQARTFVRRIGCEESAVVQYAMTICGVATFDDADVQGDHLNP